MSTTVIIDPPGYRGKRPAFASAPVKYIRLPQLQQIVPFTDMHFGRLEKKGEFPKRVIFGQRCVAWNLDEVLAWVEERKANPPPYRGRNRKDPA